MAKQAPLLLPCESRYPSLLAGVVVLTVTNSGNVHLLTISSHETSLWAEIRNVFLHSCLAAFNKDTVRTKNEPGSVAHVGSVGDAGQGCQANNSMALGSIDVADTLALYYFHPWSFQHLGVSASAWARETQ